MEMQGTALALATQKAVRSTANSTRKNTAVSLIAHTLIHAGARKKAQCVRAWAGATLGQPTHVDYIQHERTHERHRSALRQVMEMADGVAQAKEELEQKALGLLDELARRDQILLDEKRRHQEELDRLEAEERRRLEENRLEEEERINELSNKLLLEMQDTKLQSMRAYLANTPKDLAKLCFKDWRDLALSAAATRKMVDMGFYKRVKKVNAEAVYKTFDSWSEGLRKIKRDRKVAEALALKEEAEEAAEAQKLAQKAQLSGRIGMLMASSDKMLLKTVTQAWIKDMTEARQWREREKLEGNRDSAKNYLIRSLAKGTAAGNKALLAAAVQGWEGQVEEGRR